MRFELPTLTLTFALTLAACSGGVVVDPAVQGGGGGAGGGTGGSAGTSPSGPATGTTAPASATTGTGTTGLCDGLCASLNAIGCGDSECASECKDQVAMAGACADELTLAFQCWAGNVSGCDVPPTCAAEVEAYDSCASPGDCGSGNCSVGSDGSCACKAMCDGETLSVECGSGFCACLVDGQPIGKCENVGFECGLFESCCGEFF